MSDRAFAPLRSLRPLVRRTPRLGSPLPPATPDPSAIDKIHARASLVDSAVYVDGEVVYADGRFTKIDRDAVLKEIHDILAQPRTEDEIARRQLGFDVFPHVKTFYEGYIRDEPRKPFYEASSAV